MIYIIAGNSNQADVYRRSRNLERKEIFYVSSPEKLMTRVITRDDEVQYVGTCSFRNDLDEIKSAIECCILRQPTDPEGEWNFLSPEGRRKFMKEKGYSLNYRTNESNRTFEKLSSKFQKIWIEHVNRRGL